MVWRVAVKTLAESESRVRLQTVLCEHFGQGLRLEIEVGATGDATAHAVAQIERAARQQAAEDAVAAEDRKSTRLNSVTNAHLVCRLLLEKKNTHYNKHNNSQQIKYTTPIQT